LALANPNWRPQFALSIVKLLLPITPSLLYNIAYRTVDQQVQQVVDIAHPGPLAGRFSPEQINRAQAAVQKALDNWFTRHGVQEAGPRAGNKRGTGAEASTPSK